MRIWIGLAAVSWLVALASSHAIAASQRGDDGNQVYHAACASCHDTGLDGAPITGQPGDWTERSDLWEAVLVEHVKNGYLNMPAKGGDSALTEYDAGVAAEYMLNQSHPELPRDSAD